MSIGKRLSVVVLGALTLAACGGGAPEAEAPPATTAAAPAAAVGTATISGKVSFEGEPPAAEKVRVSADPRCAQMHPQGLEKETVDVGEGGGLAHAFVYIKSGLSGDYPTPTEPVLLDQQGCMYHPHVIGVQAGQPIQIRNSDDTLHNIHPRPTLNEEFNIGQARKGAADTKTFDKQEIMIPVGCDVHPWMRSYISVVGHPFFAVSNDDGTYEISNVPAGEYEIEVHHGRLKTQTQKISVKDGEKATADFTYKG